MLDVWEFLRDEHNRAVLIMIGGGAAAVCIAGWAVFRFFWSSNAGDSSDLQVLADKALAVAEAKGTLSQRVQDLELENRHLQRQLTAALERVNTTAQAGDPQAVAAISEVRATGDLTALDAALKAELLRREDEIKSHSKDWFELCREAAAVAFIRGDLDSARQRWETVVRSFPLDVAAIMELGHIHRIQGRLAEANAAYQKTLELEPNDEVVRAVGSTNLAIVRMELEELDSAEEMVRVALDINDRLERRRGLAISRCVLAAIHTLQGKLEEAEDLLQTVLVAHDVADVIQSVAHHGLATIMEQRGRVDEADSLYTKSLEIAERAQWLEGVAFALIGLASVALRRNTPGEALEIYEKCLEIGKTMRSSKIVAIAQDGIGDVHYNRKDFSSAEAAYRAALPLERNLGRTTRVARICGLLGILAGMRGDDNRALELLSESQRLFETLGMKELAKNASNAIRELKSSSK